MPIDGGVVQICDQRGPDAVNSITLSGIYGREMFETWYAMSVLVAQGLDITPCITRQFAAEDFERAFATARGTMRQGSAQPGAMMYDDNLR